MAETPVLACLLDALDRVEQERRAALAEELASRFVSIEETVDGYRARLPYEAGLAREALEWLQLERRCCPFLRLHLGFEPENDTMWIGFGGGPGVKTFLQNAGLHTRRSTAACC